MTDFDFEILIYYFSMMGYGILVGLIYMLLFRLFKFKSSK